MPSLFERYIGIDWSGASTDDARVDVRVAMVTDGGPRIVPPPYPRARAWTRNECVRRLCEELKGDQPRTLVAIDMPFGLPWGADQALFGVEGWHNLVTEMARRYGEASPPNVARETAISINEDHPEAPPYRFDEGRNDRRFYLQHGVAYWRLVEDVVPQAISAWYVGSGASVGLQTISGMAAMSRLLLARDRGEIAFTAWPHEGLALPTAGHVIAECYPALSPRHAKLAETYDRHERDALAVSTWFAALDQDGRLAPMFAPPELPFGRVVNLSFADQIQFEGWMLGASP